MPKSIIFSFDLCSYTHDAMLEGVVLVLKLFLQESVELKKNTRRYIYTMCVKLLMWKVLSKGDLMLPGGA